MTAQTAFGTGRGRRATAQMELSFCDPAEAPAATESSAPGDLGGETLAALEVARDQCGFTSWREAWHAHCGGYRRAPDERVVSGAAGLLLLAALCAEDPLAEGSMLCWLAEVGAAFVAESTLSDVVTAEDEQARAERKRP